MNRFFVSVAALATVAGVAGAQSAPAGAITAGHGSVYLQPYAGYLIGGELTNDPQLTVEDKPLYGAQLGYSFSPNFTIVGNVAYSPTNFAYETRTSGTVNQRQGGNINLLLYDANLQFRVPFIANRVGSTIAPFIQVGGGAIKYSPDNNNGVSDIEKGPTSVAFNAGLGVDVQIRRLIGLRLMAKDYLTSQSFSDFSSTVNSVGDNDVYANNIALTAGLNFGF
jgi:hypothetical protein